VASKGELSGDLLDLISSFKSVMGSAAFFPRSGTREHNSNLGAHIRCKDASCCKQIALTTWSGWVRFWAASNVAFDYRIVAKRAGSENQRLEDVTERYQQMREQDEKRRERVQQRHARRAVAAPTAPRATGAIEPTAPPRSAVGTIPRYR
jgi:hypothetical protein